MTEESVGRPRMEVAPQRLRELNPHVEVEAVAENVTEENVFGWWAASIWSRPAPRCSANGCCSTVRPCGRTSRWSIAPCTIWNADYHRAARQDAVPGVPVSRGACRLAAEFPVFGATAGVVGCLGAMEAIKVLAGLGEPLYGKMLLCDLRDMIFRQAVLQRRQDCPGAARHGRRCRPAATTPRFRERREAPDDR